MLTLVPSVVGLKQNLQKVTAIVYFSAVGSIQNSPGGRREVAQEGAPMIFVKNPAECRNTWASKPQAPACEKGSGPPCGQGRGTC